MILLLFIPLFALTATALYLVVRKPASSPAAEEEKRRKERFREVMENPALRARR